jgi:uncharacterized membrane protein
MPRLTRSTLLRSLLIGVVAGMRSQTPGAVLAWRQPEAPPLARWRAWPVLRNTWGRRALTLSGAGELAADKSPLVPPRTNPGPLFGRMLFGGLAGAAIGSEGRGRGPVVRGAIAGAAGGAIGTFGGQRARAALVEMTGLPDPAVAVVEDIAAVTLANSVVRAR